MSRKFQDAASYFVAGLALRSGIEAAIDGTSWLALALGTLAAANASYAWFRA